MFENFCKITRLVIVKRIVLLVITTWTEHFPFHFSAFYFYFQPDGELPPAEEPYSKNPAFPVSGILHLLASSELIWAHNGPRL